MSVLLHPFKRFGFYTMFSFNVRILLFCIFLSLQLKGEAYYIETAT